MKDHKRDLFIGALVYKNNKRYKIIVLDVNNGI
jgi:hypothetical protein